MTFGLTRDSAIWALTFLGALVVYLGGQGNPADWDYFKWLAFIGYVLSTASAKLSGSPLKHSDEVQRPPQE